MSTVLTFGCWDLLHVGHVRFLQRARGLGDELVVGVASDTVVLEDKGQLPVVTLEHRMEMLESILCVDVVKPYYTLDFMPLLEEVKPDFLAIGEYWSSEERHNKAIEYMIRRYRFVEKIPYTQGISTSILKEGLKR